MKREKQDKLKREKELALVVKACDLATSLLKRQKELALEVKARELEAKARDLELKREKREKLKREKELALEVKARDLVTSLKQPDIEQVKKAVEYWDFKTNLVKQGQSQILNDITMNLNKVISDPGDIALLFRKVGKPDKNIPQFKSHDKYLPALDKKV